MKTQVAGPTFRVSDSVGLGWGPRICISNEMSGDSEAASLTVHVENCRLGARQSQYSSQSMQIDFKRIIMRT